MGHWGRAALPPLAGCGWRGWTCARLPVAWAGPAWAVRCVDCVVVVYTPVAAGNLTEGAARAGGRGLKTARRKKAYTLHCTFEPFQKCNAGCGLAVDVTNSLSLSPREKREGLSCIYKHVLLIVNILLSVCSWLVKNNE